MSTRLVIISMFCALLTGCTDPSYTDSGTQTDPSARTSSVSYVCVGMETSSRFGSCPGCAIDSYRMNDLFKNTFNYKGVLLQSESATRNAVLTAIRNAVSATPQDGLFIFYYSGHGGREFLNSSTTVEPQGADAADEYLCLYDTYLLDDEIWDTITKCKGRVFLVFDCCHSQTMFRSITVDFSLAQGLAIPLDNSVPMVKSTGFELKPRAIALDSEGLRMLCWSGCLEAEYSYGSSRGGVMTNAILKYWKRGISYDELWKLVVEAVTDEQPTQHPASVLYGTGFIKAFH